MLGILHKALEGVKNISLDAAKASIQNTINKLRDLRKTNYELALYHFHKGNRLDAVLRFKMVQLIWRTEIPQINYYLGRIYMESLKPAKAIKMLERYLAGGDQDFVDEAKYCMKMLRKDKNIIAVPASIIYRQYNSPSRYLRPDIITAEERKGIYKRVREHLKGLPNKIGNSLLEIGSGGDEIGQEGRSEMIFNYIARGEHNVENAKILSEGHTYDYVTSNPDEMYSSDMQYNVIIVHDFIARSIELDSYLQKIYELIKENGLFVLHFRPDDETCFNFRIEQFVFSIEDIKRAAYRNSLLVMDDFKMIVEEVRFQVVVLYKG